MCARQACRRHGNESSSDRDLLRPWSINGTRTTQRCAPSTRRRTDSAANVDYLSDNKRCATVSTTSSAARRGSSPATRCGRQTGGRARDRRGWQPGTRGHPCRHGLRLSVVLLATRSSFSAGGDGKPSEWRRARARLSTCSARRVYVPTRAGCLLYVTWRMHPAIRQFISNVMYDGRLIAHPALCPAEGTAGTGPLHLSAPHRPLQPSLPQRRIWSLRPRPPGWAWTGPTNMGPSVR